MTIKYTDYQNSRNAAWQLILDLNINQLPVSIARILQQLGIPLYAYNENMAYIRENQLDRLLPLADAFTIRTKAGPSVFYDDTLPPTRIRFTLAHELGHIILGHLQDKSVTTRNREPATYDAPEEQAANVFAARLLAPACVLHELEAFSPDAIAGLCKISMQSAQYRAKRLQELEERNIAFENERGYGTFYRNPLEEKVRDQFSSFIAGCR